MDFASTSPPGWISLWLCGSILVDCLDGQPWHGVAGLVRLLVVPLQFGNEADWWVTYSRGCLTWVPRSTGFCRDPTFAVEVHGCWSFVDCFIYFTTGMDFLVVMW